ncbi:MAG TPA: NAD(P)(+) transhydrogenase (Re/Si-specific) subunit beta, partial [Bacteroidales bacterium]|nr:NAD(P)(+) transhydrogenase (Re/Si-specific) subunit beta [Bacteroidales bacterium]
METITKLIPFTGEISILEISYLVASVLFILGLKKLSHPATARSGNLWAAAGMTAAILFTILFHKKDGEPIGNIVWIVVALAIGSFIGWYASKKVKMTAMPQMVSIFNGMGGACAALISMMEFPKMQNMLAAEGASHMIGGEGIAILLGLMIGGVSFAGSMIAFGKLDGRIGDIKNPVLRIINLTFLVLLLVALV